MDVLLLVRKDMDVNEYKTIQIQHYTSTQIKVKEQCFFAVLHFSHRMVFNNVHNLRGRAGLRQCRIWRFFFLSDSKNRLLAIILAPTFSLSKII